MRPKRTEARQLRAMMVVGLRGCARAVVERGGERGEYLDVVLASYDRYADEGRVQSDTREQRRQLACHVWDATYGART